MSDVGQVHLREFDSASLTGSNQNLGAVIAKPVLGFQAVNNSDVEAYITDGVSNYRIPPGVISIGQVDPFNVKVSGKVIAPANTQYEIRQVTGAGTGGIWLHIVTERV